ncbi:MAG: glutamine synthetase family protein [Negativicutes bacterium]
MSRKGLMIVSMPKNVSKSSLLKSVDKIIRDNDIKYVRFEQYDLYGMSRSKTVPIDCFLSYVENGLNFYGGLLGLDIQSLVPSNTGYAEEVAYADHLTVPDLSTFQVLTWLPNTARIIIDPFWYDGTPAMASPRLILKKLLEEYAALGYTVRMGYEFEFYMLNKADKSPVYKDQPIFNTLKNNWDIKFTYDLMEKMRQAGVRIITQNSEHGPGQQEINLYFRDGIEAPDEAMFFKGGIKEIAGQHDYIATFMTKPYIASSASGSHFHLSLINTETGENAFYDAADEKGLSPVCKSFIAGLLEHAEANTVFSAPTINCYKRYRVNSFAPHSNTWGFENRTVGIRIKGGRGMSTHLENRLACGGTNPYLLAISNLAAGLIGIRKQLTPPPPIADIAYNRSDVKTLPATLDASLTAFKTDKELQEILGAEFVKLFVAVKEFEIEKAQSVFPDYGTPEFNNRVDPWEWNEYMEFI